MPQHSGSDRTVVYAHNPHTLMVKQTTTRAGQTRSNGRKPAKRTGSGAKRAPRRNPSTPTRSRRNPSFGSRAGKLYKQAGGLILGGIAAEQVGIIIQGAMPASTPATVGTVVPAAATGALGVFMAGMRGDLASNVGLGMVVTSAANLVAFGASKLGIGGASLSTASDRATKGGTGRALRAPAARALPATSGYDAGCGCSRSVAGLYDDLPVTA